MRMRPEFEYIREYNSQIIDLVIARDDCNKSLRDNLRELEYYRTAEPAPGLDSYCQTIVWQVIKVRKNELYDEISRLRRHFAYLTKRQSMTKFLVELHTASY